VYTSGDVVELRFSEPIAPETLAIRLWAGPRDIEGEVVTNVAPLLETCHVLGSGCNGAAFSMSADDLTRAELTLPPDGLGKPNTPLILEVLTGLADQDGNTTGRSTFIGLQFVPAQSSASGGDVAFDDGNYIFVATLDQPIPGMVISLLMDIVVTPNGVMALAGADADAVEGAPENTTEPSELYVDVSERGFAFFTTGAVSSHDDARFFETEPVDLFISLGPLQLTVANMVMTGTVVAGDSASGDGLEGTMSWTEITLNAGGNVTRYAPASTGFVGKYVAPEFVPPGGPSLCGKLCGDVPAQCEPPKNFPPNEICNQGVSE